MFHVYVLQSKKNHKRYIGFTSKNVADRLHDHHNGSNKWTRQNGPFEIMYTEDFFSKTDAIRRERFLKSGQGRKFLDELLKLNIRW